MTPSDMKLRTKRFALEVIKLAKSVPVSTVARVITQQMIRSGTSVGANYRAACRARSKADFIAKLGIVEEEADETAFWLELLIESGLLSRPVIQPLLKEADELTRILHSSRKTAKET